MTTTFPDAVTVLAYEHDDFVELAPQRVFEAMIQLSGPVVKSYRTDFYHDAMWVNKNIASGEVTEWYYGYDECGTMIAWDPETAPEHTTRHRKNVVHFRITTDDRGRRILVRRSVQEA